MFCSLEVPTAEPGTPACGNKGLILMIVTLHPVGGRGTLTAPAPGVQAGGRALPPNQEFSYSGQGSCPAAPPPRGRRL